MSGKAKRPRLFKLSVDEEVSKTKELTIKGIGLLSRNAQTLDQGVKLLRQILPSLCAETMPTFLHILFQVNSNSKTKENAEPRAVREVIRILGECVRLQPDLSTPYARKIIHYIISHLQAPEGSIDKMHQQCASSLTEIATSIPPGYG